MAELYRYAAFISYSSKDAPFAKRLHGALERYTIPKALGEFDLIGDGKKNRIHPVFRDREELSVGELGEAIEAALRGSANLIVVCSPDAAASRWVEKEIHYFAGLGRHGRIFAVIAGNAPMAEAGGGAVAPLFFPAALSGAARVGDEPLAADARKDRDGFDSSVLKLVAGMIGVSPGDLINRDRRRRARQAWARGAAAFAGAAILAIVGSAMDARSWRADLTSRAESLASAGEVMDAMPVALAGVAARGDLLQIVSSGGEALVARLGAVRVQRELGALGELRRWELSPPDGAFLMLQRSNEEKTSAVVDLATGEQTELGPTSTYWFLRNNRIAVADLQGHGAVIDLAARAKTDLGDMRNWLVSKNLSRLAVLLRNGEGVTFDAGSGMLASLGALGAISCWSLSDDGSALFVQRVDNSALFFDLRNGQRIDLPPLGPSLNCYVSPDGGILFLQRQNAAGEALVFTVRSGSLRELGAMGDLSRVTFSDEALFAAGSNASALYTFQSGAVARFGPVRSFDLKHGMLVIQNADMSATLINVATGRRTPLGLLEHFEIAEGGATLFLQNADTARTSAVMDLGSGAKTDLGALGSLFDKRLLNEGRSLVFRRDEPAHTGAVIDLLSRQRRELGPVRYSLDFSNNLRRLFLQRDDPQSSSAVIDLPTGDTTDTDLAGRNIFHLLSDDGGVLAVQRDDARKTSVVLRTSARNWPLGGRPRGAALSRAVCAANADQLAPVPAQVRKGDDARLRLALAGRPWNPCDWRGLGAIFPNASTGDGWLEGVRQWLRLVNVRYFGGRDWICEEALAGAPEQTRAARRRMCAQTEPSGALAGRTR